MTALCRSPQVSANKNCSPHPTVMYALSPLARYPRGLLSQPGESGGVALSNEQILLHN